MGPDSVFWLIVAARMAAAACVVVLATRVAERAGPLIGAMVATLPVSGGPVYVFIALDHDRTFVATSALASLTVNAASIAYCAAHARVAQSRGVALSLAAALGIWVLLALAIRSIGWTLPSAIFLNALALAVCLPTGRKFRDVPMPRTIRCWYDLPLRAGMVATLVAVVVALSTRIGPTVTGILALFPIVLTSMILIFQPRVGGVATAALTANAVAGLGGYGAALVVLHLAAVPLGSFPALGLALLVSVAWNLSILAIRGRKSAARSAAGALGPPAASEPGPSERRLPS